METTDLFHRGVAAFNCGHYYDAHEFWEEIWVNQYVADADLIQGLIQLTVGYFHITNFNLKGARSLLNKCLPKLQKFPNTDRIQNIEQLLNSTEKSIEHLNIISQPETFNWKLVTKITTNE